MRTHQLIAILLMILALPGAAFAQLHNGDIVLWVENDKVLTGGSTGGNTYALSRVFAASFGTQGVTNFTTSPGLNTVPGQFPGNQPLGLTIRKAARRWAPEGFCTVPTETLTLYRSAASITSPATDPSLTQRPSLTIGITASGTGFLHTHPTWGLDTPFGDGVYALELEAWVGSAAGTSPAPSDPFWVMLRQNVSQAEADAAAEWLLTHVASVPGPGGPLCPPAPACTADFNGVGGVSIDDLFLYLNAWFIGAPAADVNHAGGVNIDDLFLFLNAWFTGCP